MNRKLLLLPTPLVVLLACGEPETVTETVWKTTTVPNTITVEVPGETVEVPVEVIVEVPTVQLQPGHWEEVMVELRRLQDNGTGATVGANGAGENHMHLSDVIHRDALPDTNSQMMYCSYTFGVLNADNEGNESFQAQGFTHLKTTGTKNPGCIHLNADDTNRDIIYTTHHGGITDGLGFLSGWDLNMVNDTVDADLNGIPDNPTKVTLAPTEIPKLTENTQDVDGDGLSDVSTSYEGLDNENGYIYVTKHLEGLGVYTYDAVTQIFTPVSNYTNLENAWGVGVVDTIAYVTDGIGGLVSLDVADPMNIVELDRLPLDGQARDIAFKGDIAYVATESGGIAVVDISDPENLVLEQQMSISGSAIMLDTDDDYLYVAAWNDARVYDTTIPEAPTFIGAARQTTSKSYDEQTGVVVDEGDRPDITDRVLSIAGNGDIIYNGTWWVPYTFQVFPDRMAPYMVLPETVAQVTFPGEVNFGDTLDYQIEILNDGTAPLTIYDLWSNSPAFSSVEEEFLIQPGDTATLTLQFTPTIGADQGPPVVDTANPFTALEEGIFYIVSDDPQQPIREIFMQGNLDGIGVGDPFPETTATLTDGSEWSFTNDALGSVTLVIYFATF